MKEMENSEEKKIKRFDYQKFIEVHNLDKSSLDPQLVKMIDLVEGHLADAVKNCTGSTCIEITNQLQLFADFIMDELWEHIEINGLPDDTPEPRDSDHEEVDEIEALYNKGERTITSRELKLLGIDEQLLAHRIIEIGQFKLVRELMSSKWHIYRGIQSSKTSTEEKEDENA